MKKFITTYKMVKNAWRLSDIEVDKHKFHQHKSPILAYNLDVNKIVVSNKFPFSNKKGFKYLIGYKDGKKIIHNASKNECI